MKMTFLSMVRQPKGYWKPSFWSSYAMTL